MSIISLQEALDFLGVTAGYFRVNAASDVMNMTSSGGGPVNLDIADGTYSGAELATALQTLMNASATLKTGGLTFTVAYSTTTRKFTITASGAATITVDVSESDAAILFGFTADPTAATVIVSDHETGDPTAMVTEFRDGAEKWFKTYCRRDFEETAYTLQRCDGTGIHELQLDNYPVSYVDRLSVGTLDAVKICNTTVYGSATVAVMSTGLRLVKNGTADVTCTFATYPTMATLVAAVNLLGAGWSAATLSTNYDALRSVELIADGRGVNAINSNWVYLEMPDDPEDDYELYADEGILRLSYSFPKGYRNVFVDYTAGYTAAAMPEDVKLAVRLLIKFLYQRWSDSSYGLKSYTFGEISVTFDDVSALPKQVLDIAGLYRRRLV